MIMARPIAETPILFGEDARRFEARMNENRKVSKETLTRMKESYETVKQWFENGRIYEEQLKASNANS